MNIEVLIESTWIVWGGVKGPIIQHIAKHLVWMRALPIGAVGNRECNSYLVDMDWT